MKLITAHRILIFTAVVFFLFFGLWEFRNYAASENFWAAIRGVLYLAVGGGFGVYLQRLRRWYK